MVDFIKFLFTCFYNLILWFDNFTIIGTLSILKIIIITILIIFIYQFIGGKKND